MFFLIILVLYVTINAVSSFVLSLAVSDAFESSLLQSMVSGLSFLFTFIMVARHYISTAPSGFWMKFIVIALASFSFYAVLALSFGEPLLRAMGFEVTTVPPNSLLSPSEYNILAFYTYGISSITNGLLSVAVGYFLQKYVVRGLFQAFKRVTKYRNFIESDASKGNSHIVFYVLWLVLLPFPVQNVLSPNPVGVSVLGTGTYLLSTLALFALWGLGLTALVGVTRNSVFRLYSAFRDTLLWFVAIQWLSSLVYSSFASPALVNSLVTSALLLVRAIFAFGPPALITAYLYKGVFEKRAETRIIEYLKREERLETAKIAVKAE